MKKTRVGVIGAGGIGRRHIRVFQGIPEVELAALCDINPGRLEQVGREHGIPALFSDWRELVKSGLEAVAVCSPNAFHAPQSIAALRAGKHVLCEKPVCLDAAEAEEILAVAREAGKIFMGGFRRRFDPGVKFLRGMIERGEFGEIYHLGVSWLVPRGIPNPGSWFTSRRLAGGGALIDTGVHALDLVIHLAGAPMPRLVVGRTFDSFIRRTVAGAGAGDAVEGGMDVEDLATGYAVFDNGATLSVSAAWDGHVGFGLETLVMGTYAGARLLESLDPARPLVIYRGSGPAAAEIVPKTAATDLLAEQGREFIACIREGRPSPLGENEVLSVARIIDGIYRSAESGEPVTWP